LLTILIILLEWCGVRVARTD